MGGGVVMKPTRELARFIIEEAPHTGREGLIDHVLRALTQAYEQGKADGHPEARLRALREELAIVQGLGQDARSREQTISREIEDLERSRALAR